MKLSTAAQQIEENWSKIRAEIRQQWPQMTKEDVKLINGDSRKLIALVHQKTGLRLDEIEKQIDQVAANSSGLLSRVSQSTTNAVSVVSEAVSEKSCAAFREIKNTVAGDVAKSTAAIFGVGLLIGFCAIKLLGQRPR